MELMLENISKMSADDIIDIISDKLSKIYSSYKYVGISKDEYLVMVKNIVLSSQSDFDNSCNYEDYILDKIKTEISNIITASLYDDEKVFEILNNYVNEKLDYATDYESATNSIHMFVRFLENYEYIVSGEILTRLIEENSKFYSCVNEYVKQKIDIIQSNGVSILSSNINIQTIVRSYCIKHDIETNDIDEKELYFDDAYESFLHQIKQIPVLTAEEQKDLLVKAKAGNKYARDKLVNSNMMFVVKMANSFYNRGVPLIDLAQEGSIGLIDAIESFDMSKNNNFLTYACYHVRKTMLRSISESGRNIKIPLHMQTNLNKYKTAVNSLMESLERTPTIEEVANYMDMSVDKIKKIMVLLDDTVSINALISENTELEDFISDRAPSVEEEYISGTLIDTVREVINGNMFDDREKQVLKLRFGFEDGRTWRLKEIGEKLGISRERVRQIESKSLKRLRYSLSSRNLVDYSSDPDKVIKEIKTGVSSKKNNEDLKETSDVNTIYENFNGYTRNQINSVILGLGDTDIKLIKKKYGDRFLGTCDAKSLSRMDSFIFYKLLVPKIKRKLAVLYGNVDEVGISKTKSI